MLSAWIVGALCAVLQSDRQPVVPSIDTLHLRVLAFPNAGLLRGARVAQHIAHLVPLGPGTVRAGEILTRHQRSDAVLLTTHDATPLKLRMDALVDLRAGAVVRRNDQRVLRRFCVLLRDGSDAFVVAVNLVDSALAIKSPPQWISMAMPRPWPSARRIDRSC